MADMDKKDIARKLRALRERTTENGCTEEEAYAAAAMALKLQTKYNLSMSDIEIGVERCLLGFVETGRLRHHEAQYTLHGIKVFTDTICYLDNCPTGKMICFFGQPEDVELAKYLTKMIKGAMDQELAVYKARCKMIGEPTGRRQSHSFLLGMARRVSSRLQDMKREANRETKQTTGRDLVLVKGTAVQAAFDKDLPFKLGRGRSTYTTNSDRGAYQDGQAAGSRVNLNRPIGGCQGGHLLGKD